MSIIHRVVDVDASLDKNWVQALHLSRRVYISLDHLFENTELFGVEMNIKLVEA